jgi:dienelactone hydrolase
MFGTRPRASGPLTKRYLANAGALLWLLLLTSPTDAADASNCHIGTYRLNDGTTVDIAPSAGKALRWRRFDGTTGELTEQQAGDWTGTIGWTGRPDGTVVRFSACTTDVIDFAGQAGHRLTFDVQDSTFAGQGVSLVGRLIMPKGAGRVPIVVLVHGAEHDSAREFNALQRMLPAEGIGAFVYDKRGTGDSSGQYSQDFNLLADDAVAAMNEARRLAGHRTGRFGYQGGSQAGWVLPIAANRSRVNFVIVSFGLAVSVIDEDQQEVEIEMRERGHSPAEIASALEVARAAETVMASGFTAGFAELDAARSRYKNSSWYKDLHGNYTFALLPYSEVELRRMKDKFRWGTPFYYDPMPTLRASTTPHLWILGGEDYEAPSAETSRRIRSLMADRLPYTLALFPQAEHGMTLFELAGDGQSRLSTRYAPGYFAMIRDFARDGRLHGTYGDAQVMRGRRRKDLQAAACFGNR